MGISSDLRDKVLKHVFNISTYSPPTTLYLALGDGTGLFSEISGGSYARQTIAFHSPAADKLARPLAFNETVIKLEPTDQMDWWSVTQFAIYDASSGGNMLFSDDFEPNLTLAYGDSYTIRQERIHVYFFDQDTADPEYTYWSKYLQGQLLDLVFAGGSYSPPSTIKLDLTSAKPEPDDGVADLQKVAGGGYAEASNASWQFNAGNNDVTNSAQIDFPTATGAWSPDATHGVLHDGTNVLFWHDFPSAVQVASDDQPYFATDALSFTMG